MKEQIIRLIALDVRPRRIAYAVFEHPARLLDWGTRMAGPGTTMSDGLKSIVMSYRPSTLVLRSIEPASRRDNPRTRRLLQVIQTDAEHLAITAALLSEQKLKSFFQQHGRTTKHEIAEAIGEWFPELTDQVPGRRKPWQPEHWRTTVFDAIGLGTAYLFSLVPPDEFHNRVG